MDRTSAPTSYDLLAYPSGVFATTHPQHLATVARLAGLSPPPVETARVLEIGGGDGMNVMAMAAGLPDARFLSIDLAATAVARGRALAERAGLGNVRVEIGDVVEAAETMDERFDYVVAHGLLAWVAAPVRAALMKLIGRVLTPDGVAYVSYNALPGGHLRRVIREMVLHHVAPIADLEERLVAGRAYIEAFSRRQDDDRPVLAALRDVARPMAAKGLSGLRHDELAEEYAPQAFGDVVAAAQANGLAFLNETEPALLQSGLPGEEMSEEDVIRAVQATDYAAMCFFHQTLFVRAERPPARSPDWTAIRDLYVAAHCERTAPTEFKSDDGSFGISDLPLAEAVATIGGAWPRRLRVGDLVDDDMRVEAMYRLTEGKAVQLFSVPLPGVAEAGDRPLASPLVRALIAADAERVYTLDCRVLLLDEPGPRAFLSLLDGSRDRGALEAAWAATPYAAETTVANALERFGQGGLLVA